MDRSSNVTVHESAFPAATRKRMADSLRRGELDPALLYGSLGQTLRWIALHHGCSPAKTDPAIATLYDEAFRRVGGLCKGNVAHVVSLACGDGTKDTRSLEVLRTAKRAVLYTPVDVSLQMVLSAEDTATTALSGLQCTPLLCDLPHCTVLPALLKAFDPSGAERILLFLGTIHNYWPPDILRSLVYPLRSQDHLLLSANLAPEADYERALTKILPQYDNALTRDWLHGALAELTITPVDGTLGFSIQPAESLPSLKRLQADFTFGHDKQVHFFGEQFQFSAGQKLRVFYSYRFTPAHIRDFLAQSRLKLAQEWIGPAGEEGLFLCHRAG